MQSHATLWLHIYYYDHMLTEQLTFFDTLLLWEELQNEINMNAHVPKSDITNTTVTVVHRLYWSCACFHHILICT